LGRQFLTLAHVRDGETRAEYTTKQDKAKMKRTRGKGVLNNNSQWGVSTWGRLKSTGRNGRVERQGLLGVEVVRKGRPKGRKGRKHVGINGGQH